MFSPELGVHHVDDRWREGLGVDLHGRLFRELELLLVYQFLDDVSQNNAVVGVVRPRTVVKDCLGPGQIKSVGLRFPSREFNVGNLGATVVGLDQSFADEWFVDVDLGRAHVDLVTLGLFGAVGFG
ncbi:unnamed protein product, partial [Prunus brigantina]